MSIRRVPSREINEFIIRMGVRLEAQNKTVATAILILYRLASGSLLDNVCNHTLAAAAVILASKHEEDNTIGIRDVVNTAHRILHPDEEMLTIDTLQWNMRKGIARLEFVLLRELDFDLDFEHPFKLLSIYLDQLRSWMPDEFAENAIAESAMAICRDCYVCPVFIVEHSPESVAVCCIAVTLHSMQLTVEYCRNWYEVLHKPMTDTKLRRLEEELLSSVYGLTVE